MTTTQLRRPTAPDPVRRAAFDVLRAVAQRDAYANLVLPGLLRERGLTGRDAGFATELAYGTLRGQGFYDAVLGACSDRQLRRIDVDVLLALRLGAHQLLAMRVPAHAGVSATVDLVRSVTGTSASRFANAVLRRIAERDRDAWVQRLAPSRQADLVGHLAMAHAHPRWVVEAFLDSLGDAAEVEAALAADNVPAAVVLATRPGTTEHLDDLLCSGQGTPGRWSPFAVVLAGGDPGDVPAVRSHAAGVQDEGSQLVALVAAAVPVEGLDTRWLDGCAGPGGKAAMLAGQARGRGAHLLAAEVSEHRAGLVSRALAGLGAEVLVADTLTTPWPPASFDRVLVDVPCTGLGALRRRPEARWRRVPADLDSLGPLQRGLLHAALDSTRPGGVVTYATCSPHLRETRDVVADVLAVRGDAEQIDVRPVLGQVAKSPLPSLGDGPAVQLWPHRHGTDAMYLAVLRKRVRTAGV